MKNILNKVNSKTILSAIVTVAGLITTVDQLVSGRKQAAEFEEMKKVVAELQKKN